jgi:hypothetical protein
MEMYQLPLKNSAAMRNGRTLIGTDIMSIPADMSTIVLSVL